MSQLTVIHEGDDEVYCFDEATQVQSTDMSTKKAHDWLTQMILDVCSAEGWSKFFQTFVLGDDMISRSKDVIQSPYGYVHVLESGKVRKVDVSSDYLEVVLAKRPIAIETRLRVHMEFRGFEISFLKDISSIDSFISANVLRRTYEKYKFIQPFDVAIAVGLLKKLVEGTRFDFDISLSQCGAEIYHNAGLTCLRKGDEVFISCGFSRYSNIVIWFMFLAYYDMDPTVSRAHDRGNEDGSDAILGLKHRSVLRYNPLVAFRILRFYCLGM
jgi:hypothetical protein